MSENIVFLQQVRDAGGTTLDTIIANLSSQAQSSNNAPNTVKVMANSSTILPSKSLNFVNTATVTVNVADNGDGNANISFTSVGGSATPNGSNTWIQFNNSGSSLGATANLTYNIATNTTQANGNVIINGINVTSVLASAYARANSDSVYANGGLILANSSNLNFNNTATINVAISANGQQTNLAFSVNTSSIAAGNSTTVTSYSATSTANQTVFTMSANTVGSAYVIVTRNGVLQIPGTHYNITSNNVLTFTSNTILGDLIEARIFSTGAFGSSGGTPGGTNTQIQLNDSGIFGSSANLTFDKATNTLNANGNLIIGGGINVGPTIAAIYNQANNAINTTAVSANSQGLLPGRILNFINTSSTLVSVTDVGNGNANIAFNQQVIIMVPMSDLNTAITTGTTKAYIRSPKAFTLNDVRGSLLTASTSGNVTVQIKKNGANILSTVLSVSQGSTTSTGNSVPEVISTSAIADNDLLTFDIVTAGTNAVGLMVTLIGQG